MQKIYTITLLILVVFLGYKGYENLRENNKKGICLYTNSFLTKNELYKNSVYSYIEKEMEYLNDIYDVSCIKIKKCGLYYLKKEQELIEEKVKKFNVDNSDFVNLIENRNMNHVKINSLYHRGLLESGDINIFIGVYSKSQIKDIWLSNNANYYLGIRHIFVDKDNNLMYSSFSLEPYFIPIDNCGKLILQ